MSKTIEKTNFEKVATVLKKNFVSIEDIAVFIGDLFVVTYFNRFGHQEAFFKILPTDFETNGLVALNFCRDCCNYFNGEIGHREEGVMH